MCWLYLQLLLLHNHSPPYCLLQTPRSSLLLLVPLPRTGQGTRHLSQPVLSDLSLLTQTKTTFPRDDSHKAREMKEYDRAGGVESWEWQRCWYWCGSSGSGFQRDPPDLWEWLGWKGLCMNVITIVQRDKSRSTREVIHFEISTQK